MHENFILFTFPVLILALTIKSRSSQKPTHGGDGADLWVCGHCLACAQLKFGFSFQALTASLKLLGPWFIVNGLLPVSLVRADAYSTKACSGSFNGNNEFREGHCRSHMRLANSVGVPSFFSRGQGPLIMPRILWRFVTKLATGRLVNEVFAVLPSGKEFEKETPKSMERASILHQPGWFGVISKGTDRIRVSYGG
ncbi:hypothetical protein Tco_0799686 [Tanacetum coccineum]|uniref:Uncharacterized protein n=1 Tax=Tanacetum coccineum TaxID=301880 RepID=A0ABQ4ZV48_9ASTR